MRIKKLIFSPVKTSSGKVQDSAFEVELAPFEDDTEFEKTGKIAYKLLFPQLDGKFLVDIRPNLNTANEYNVTIEVPAFLLSYFDRICVYRGVNLYVGGNNGNGVHPLITFSMPMDILADEDKKLFIQIRLSTSVPTNKEENNSKEEKLKNFLFIREKKFLQEYSLGRMLKSEVNCRDFTILAGNSEIRVHKCILSAQSKVFAQMLSLPMDEARNSLLRITDIQENSVRIAIDFMYSGQLKVKGDNIELGEILRGLYVFAQKYDMVNLKWSVFEKCQTHMDYFNENPEEKHKFIQIATLHETMDDLNSFLVFFGPYTLKK